MPVRFPTPTPSVARGRALAPPPPEVPAPALIAPEAPAPEAPAVPPRTAPTGAPGLGYFAAHAGGTPGLFDLAPANAPGAVPLGTLLSGLGASPAGQAAVKKLLAAFEAETGLRPPPALVAAALAKPARVADVLRVTPGQLDQGVVAMNAAYQAGKLPELPPKARRLPARFDLAKLETIPFSPATPELKELAPGLYQGDLPSTASPAAQRRNAVLAEVFDRLADNVDQPAAERFRVRYGGRSFTRLDRFVAALAEDGHELVARVEHRVANFANLKAKGPDGAILDVPAALMVRTGFFGPSGEEAVVPATHSELVISIRPKAAEGGEGPRVEADLKWYQGLSGTGFWPCDATATPAWCGRKVADTLSGEAALDAIHLAGLLGDVIEKAARDQKLAIGGYGVTGVCNDSVAVIQQALTGRTTAFPLLMRDESLAAELEARLGDALHLDDPAYARLAAAIAAVPRDAGPADPTRRGRTLAALPWGAGEAPLVQAERARAILAG